jgi:hypothetical protein
MVGALMLLTDTTGEGVRGRSQVLEVRTSGRGRAQWTVYTSTVRGE